MTIEVMTSFVTFDTPLYSLLFPWEDKERKENIGKKRRILGRKEEYWEEKENIGKKRRILGRKGEYWEEKKNIGKKRRILGPKLMEL